MPPKAMWMEFQSSPELEFEFRLAKELGMTVARMRAEMDNDEFIRWAIYFGRKWQRENQKVVASSGTG